jgi:GNAT superfamily N-acetyltransferase
LTGYRKLFPSEAGRLASHLQRLTSADRRLRFFGAVSDAGIDAHCRRIDWMKAVVIGFFDAAELRGAVEIRFTGPGRAAEIALSVESGWQNRGVGAELLRRATMIAENRGASLLEMIYLPENARVQNLVRDRAAAFSIRDGAVAAELHLAMPTPATLLAEIVEDGFAAMALFLDRLSVSAARAGTAGRG